MLWKLTAINSIYSPGSYYHVQGGPKKVTPKDILFFLNFF